MSRALSGASGWFAAVALLSGGVIGYEIALMRLLLVASWHHFAFLVISVALLGFGVSGTVLCLASRFLRRAPAAAFLGLTLAAALAMPACAAAAQHVPVEARIVPGSLAEQIAAWVSYWAIWSVPFVLGASAIGLALMAARDRVGLVYSADLLGAGLGSALVTGAMTLLPPAWLPPAIGAWTAGAALLAPTGRLPMRLGAVGAVAATGAALLVADPPTIRVDPYKHKAQVERLASAGRAERIAADWGPRGLVEAYAGDAFHHVPFLGPDARPPRLHELLVDGHHAGSMIAATRPAQAKAVDHTLMAAAYDAAPARPRALILNATSGVNAWLALRRDAASVHVAQPNDVLRRLWRGPLKAKGGAVFGRPRVRVIPRPGRQVLEHGAGAYDVIQLAGLQSAGTGAGGLAGLAENHLVTVEGMRAALGRLRDDGVVFVCRGIQSPPRGNLKLLATFDAALRARGVERPARHVAMVRDYLGVCTLVRATPWSREAIAGLRALCERRRLTPVWFPGIRDAELNAPDTLPGPDGEAGGWYHHAAERILHGHASSFIDEWRFDIRPPTDDRPFFHDFCKLSALGAIRAAYGRFWLTRVEVGFLFVLAALGVIGAAALAVIVAPVLLMPAVRRSPGKGATGLYFLAIGLGYLMLEVTALSRLTHLIGDPVIAAALVLATFLVVSGAGSALADGLRGRIGRTVPWALSAIVIAACAGEAAFSPLAAWAGGLPLAGRLAVGAAIMAPLALAMGFPMPAGLARVDAAAPPLVPWAWGVNGFASVLASPLTMALAMAWGYRVAGAAALLCYVLAGALYATLPGPRPERGAVP